MDIYATVVSVLMLLSIVLNFILIQVINNVSKENEFLEDEIKSKG